MAEQVISERPVLDRSARRVALIVAAAFFIQHLDGAIINTSLPQLAESFAVQPVDINIGITAYLLSMAAFIPLGGWIADRFGAKHVFAAAIVIFAVASIACGLSQTLWQFAVARIVQGAGAALMAPVGRIVVLRNTEKSSLIDAIALTVWPALIAPVIGPLIGGLITTYVSWRLNFLINIPLGAIELAAVMLFIPNHRDGEPTRLDVTGFLLTAASLMMVLYGLERLSLGGQGRMLAAGLIAGGIVLGLAAVRHLLRTPASLLDLGVFKVKTFRIATLDAGITFRLAINATPFLLPLMLQVGFGLNPWQAGLLLLVYFAGNLAMKSVTTPMLRTFGFRNVLIGNGLGVAVTVAACGVLTAATPWLATALVLFAAGLTRSMQFTCFSTLAFADISPAQRGSSSTIFNMFQQLALGFGVAFAAVVLDASRALRGAAEVGLSDFHAAFFAFGAIALVATAMVARLAPDAGAEVSGRQG
jgi:EmrB/QacA subfamily drug resistance transporter